MGFRVISGFARSLLGLVLSALFFGVQPVHAQSVSLLALPGTGNQTPVLASGQQFLLPGYGNVTVSWNLISTSNDPPVVRSAPFTPMDNQTIAGSSPIQFPATVRLLTFSPNGGGDRNGTITFTFDGGIPDLSRLQLLVHNLGTTTSNTGEFRKTRVTPDVSAVLSGTYTFAPTSTAQLTNPGNVIQNIATADQPLSNTGVANFGLTGPLTVVAGKRTLTLTVNQLYNDNIAFSLAYRDRSLPNPDEDVVLTESSSINGATFIRPPDPCCPPWNEQILRQSLVHFSAGSIGAPYTLRWQPPASLNAQMQAYINYLNAVDSTNTSITVAFGLFPAGNGASPGTPGPQVGGAGGTRFVTWTANGTAPTVSGNFFPNGSMNVGQWYTVGTSIYLNDGNTFFPETCAQNAISVRIQVTPGVRPQGGSGSSTRSAANPLEVRAAPSPVGPAAPARRARPPAR